MYPAHALATQLASHLPGWKVQLPDNDGEWADLVRADGATVRINVGGYRMDGRVAFRGCWPRFRDGTFYSGGPSESITCDVKRSPEALAKEIRRRLLPAYEAVYAKALAYVQMHDANGAEAEVTAHRVAGIIGGKVSEYRSRYGDGVAIQHEPECVRRLVVQPGYESSDGEYSRPMTVNFEVHGLDPETAATVLAIIKASEERRVAVPVRVAEDSEAEELSEPGVRPASARMTG